MVGIYFHFQLLSDLATLADRVQGSGGRLGRGLRLCRNCNAVLITARFLPLPWAGLSPLALCLALAGLAVSLLILYYLFALRNFPRTQSTE